MDKIWEDSRILRDGADGENLLKWWTGSGSAIKGDEVTTYTVTFDANRWTFDDTPADQVVTGWYYAEEPQTHPELPWYIFTGWWTEPRGGTQWDFVNDPVTTDLTLYAHWIYNFPYGESFSI